MTGRFGGPLGGLFDVHVDAETGGGEEVDETVDGEEGNLAADEVGDARLRDAEQLRGFRLRELASANETDEPAHHGGANAEVFGFGGREAEIGEYVDASHGGARLLPHGIPVYKNPYTSD